MSQEERAGSVERVAHADRGNVVGVDPHKRARR